VTWSPGIVFSSAVLRRITVAFMLVIITLSNLLAYITCVFPLLYAPGLAADLVTSKGFSLLMRPKSSWKLRYILKTLQF
jgi:hypothetical protein